MENYYYVNQSDCQEIDGVDDGEDFLEMMQCMRNIGFSQDNIDHIIDIVVAILKLG